MVYTLIPYSWKYYEFVGNYIYPFLNYFQTCFNIRLRWPPVLHYTAGRHGIGNLYIYMYTISHLVIVAVTTVFQMFGYQIFIYLISVITGTEGIHLKFLKWNNIINTNISIIFALFFFSTTEPITILIIELHIKRFF